MTIPPTSLKEIDRYLTVLMNVQIPASAAVTQFTLSAAKNEEGIAYALLTPIFRAQIAIADWAKTIVPLKQQCKDFSDSRRLRWKMMARIYTATRRETVHRPANSLRGGTQCPCV